MTHNLRRLNMIQLERSVRVAALPPIGKSRVSAKC